MFVGSPRARLDDKGRVVLPAKYRDQLAEGVVITKGQEGCLYVFPTATFQQIAKQAAEASAARPASRAAQRMLFAGAVDEVPDRQGRVTLSAALREYAGLDRNVTVVRQQQPARDLGVGGLGHLRGRAERAVRPALRGGAPRHLLIRRTRVRVRRGLQPARPPGVPSPVPGGVLPPTERAGTWSHDSRADATATQHSSTSRAEGSR